MLLLMPLEGAAAAGADARRRVVQQFTFLSWWCQLRLGTHTTLAVELVLLVVVVVVLRGAAVRGLGVATSGLRVEFVRVQILHSGRTTDQGGWCGGCGMVLILSKAILSVCQGGSWLVCGVSQKFEF